MNNLNKKELILLIGALNVAQVNEYNQEEELALIDEINDLKDKLKKRVIEISNN